MAIVQQYILSPISESFVLTFANTTQNKNLYAQSVDVDKFGNIYVVMWDFDEANVLKIEPSGTTAWKKRITDVRDSNRFSAVKVDEASGDVYCVGITYGNITSNSHLQYQCLIAKYNSSVTGAISSANLGKPDGVLYSKTNGSFATTQYPLPASIDESEPKKSPPTTAAITP